MVFQEAMQIHLFLTICMSLVKKSSLNGIFTEFEMLDLTATMLRLMANLHNQLTDMLAKRQEVHGRLFSRRIFVLPHHRVSTTQTRARTRQHDVEHVLKAVTFFRRCGSICQCTVSVEIK